MWGLVSKLLVRAISWQPRIYPAIFFPIQSSGFENVCHLLMLVNLTLFAVHANHQGFGGGFRLLSLLQDQTRWLFHGLLVWIQRSGETLSSLNHKEFLTTLCHIFSIGWVAPGTGQGRLQIPGIRWNPPQGSPQFSLQQIAWFGHAELYPIWGWPTHKDPRHTGLLV